MSDAVRVCARARLERAAYCSSSSDPAWGWATSNSARSSVSGWAGTEHQYLLQVYARELFSAGSPQSSCSSPAEPVGRAPSHTVRTSLRAPWWAGPWLSP